MTATFNTKKKNRQHALRMQREKHEPTRVCVCVCVCGELTVLRITTCSLMGWFGRTDHCPVTSESPGTIQATPWQRVWQLLVLCFAYACLCGVAAKCDHMVRITGVCQGAVWRNWTADVRRMGNIQALYFASCEVKQHFPLQGLRQCRRY